MVKSYSKLVSSAILVAIYALVYWVIYFLFPLLPIQNKLISILAADIIATIIVFIFSIVYSNSSIYDPYWSVVPPIIAIYLARLFPNGDMLRQLLVIVLVSFWSIRLTLNFFRGWPGLKHQDWRYTNIEQKTGVFYWPVSFLGIHLMPTLFVFLGCLPLWYIMSNPAPVGYVDIIAILFTLAAILIEWIADEQMMRFRRSNSRGSFIKRGLWARSRHPNYLGEITFWLGLFLFVLASSNRDGYWTICGFLAMFILFKFISIPMMEKRIKENKPGYDDYIRKVPALVLRPFGKYKS